MLLFTYVFASNQHTLFNLTDKLQYLIHTSETYIKLPQMFLGKTRTFQFDLIYTFTHMHVDMYVWWNGLLVAWPSPVDLNYRPMTTQKKKKNFYNNIKIIKRRGGRRRHEWQTNVSWPQQLWLFIDSFGLLFNNPNKLVEMCHSSPFVVFHIHMYIHIYIRISM